MAPAAQQHCLRSSRSALVDCAIVGEVRDAFAAKVAGLFAKAADPKLDLVTNVADADIFVGPSGFLQLEVRTVTRILATGGAQVDEIETVSRIPVNDQSPAALAAQAAAQDASQHFALAVENSATLSRYLVANHLANAAALAPPARGDSWVQFAVAGAVVQGGGDGGAGLSPGARLTAGLHWLVLQATYAHFQSSFQGTRGPQGFDSGLSGNDLGFEAGALIRLSPNVDLHMGPGAHYLWVSASGSSPAGEAAGAGSKLVPEVFASLSVSLFPLRNGSRFVAGIEGRGFFSTRFDLPQLNRGVPLANSAFALFLGGEVPWGHTSGGSLK